MHSNDFAAPNYTYAVSAATTPNTNQDGPKNSSTERFERDIVTRQDGLNYMAREL